MPTKRATSEDHEVLSNDLHYKVDDVPPLGIALFFGFQIALANICYCIATALIISTAVCGDKLFTSALISTTTVMAGFGTIIQTIFGVRIPIFQGPSMIFILPYVHASTDPKWGCINENGTAYNGSVLDNPLWVDQWSRVNGALLLSTGIQFIIGLTGTMAMLLRFVRPISIAVLFILLAIWLHNVVSSFVEVHWGVSMISILITIVLTQYVNRVLVPFPSWERGTGFQFTKMPVFELFPVLITVIVVWIISCLMTTFGGFTDDPDDIHYGARTDTGWETIEQAPMFRFPHPGQLGYISFGVEYFMVTLVCIVATVIESLSDYIQYSLTCCLPRPPSHAINRGVVVEGFCGMLSALAGAGHCTTSYSNIVGIIRVTKVASRRVYIIGGIILMLFGIFGKLGAVFVSIPKPVLAGPVFIGLALLCGATFMNLERVDLTAARNQATIGISIMMGVFIPFWLHKHPDAIQVGSEIGNRILYSLLSTSFLLGGLISCILDNTLPEAPPKVLDEITVEPPLSGKPPQTPDLPDQPTADQDILSVYDPPFISRWIRRWRISRYIPIFPNPRIQAGLVKDEEIQMVKTNDIK